VTLTSTNSYGSDSESKTNYISVTSSAAAILTDSRDGQTYQTVQIGEQIWMAENLNYETETGSWVYNNNSRYADIYGRLYTWEVALDACPEGWHLPGDDEWKQLEIYLGMTQNEADNLGWRGTNEGSKLAGSLDLWIGSGDLTESSEFESSEFSAVPAGHRNPDFIISDFADLGSGASWWSASGSYAREIQILNRTIYRNSFDPLYGFAVRCVKDKQ